MNTAKEVEELAYAYKIRHALDESLANLPEITLSRLATVRKMALTHKKKEAPVLVPVAAVALAGHRTLGLNAPITWLQRVGMILPMIAFIVGLVGIYEFEQQRRIADTADIDSAILTDELPPAAYLDHGFTAYLSSREE